MMDLNKIFSFVVWIGFAACLIIIIFLDRCSEKTPGVNSIEHTTTVIYDSTKRELPAQSNPVGISIQTVAIPAQVDTQAILLAYFAVHTYSDQIQDSSIRIQIFDSVSQNKIFGRRTNYQWLKPVKTIESTTVTLKPAAAKNTGIYIGGFADVSKTQQGFGPGLTWLTKKDLMFNYDFDVINKSHRVGAKIRINARGNR